MFRMTVNDVFVITGRGLAATGKVDAGSLRVGDELRINGGAPVAVDGIEAFRRTLYEATAGDNIGVLFAKLTREDIKAGDVLTGGSDVADVTAESIGLDG